MEQKPPRILQAKTSFRTINEFLSATSFIQNLLKNLLVLLELGPLPWRQMNFTFFLFKRKVLTAKIALCTWL